LAIDRQTDGTDALSHSRCRERQLNKSQSFYSTSNSAVAARPRDASRLSVASTVQCLERSLFSYFGSDLLMRTSMFCCLRRNVDAFCRKQDSLMRGAWSSVFRDQQTTPLSAIT